MSEQQTSLIEFPTDFKLEKSWVQHTPILSPKFSNHSATRPETNESHIQMRPSSGGKFVGATVTVYAKNQEHLDNIYRAVTSHPDG